LESLNVAYCELSSAFSEVFFIDFSGDGWRQAVVPIDIGGLNLKLVKLLALPCFLSWTDANSKMVEALISDRGLVVDGVDAATVMWSEQTGIAPLGTAASCVHSQNG
jgi:hypothetical protein